MACLTILSVLFFVHQIHHPPAPPPICHFWSPKSVAWRDGVRCLGKTPEKKALQFLFAKLCQGLRLTKTFIMWMATKNVSITSFLRNIALTARLHFVSDRNLVIWFRFGYFEILGPGAINVYSWTKTCPKASLNLTVRRITLVQKDQVTHPLCQITLAQKCHQYSPWATNDLLEGFFLHTLRSELGVLVGRS